MAHFKQESLKCELCFKSFSRSDVLKRHYRVHTGERPHSCNICGKAYAEKRNLNNHQKIHLKPTTSHNDLIVKPYGCKICTKSFDFESHLNYHSKSHTEERPFSCSLCGKVYKYKNNLNKHLKIHLSFEKFSDKDLNTFERNTEKESTTTVAENNHINLAPTEVVNDLEFCQNDQLLSRDSADETCNLKYALIHKIEQELCSNTDDLETKNVKELSEFAKCNIKSDSQTNLELKKNQFSGLNRYSKIEEDTGEQRKYTCFLCEKSFIKSRHLKLHQKIHLKQKSKKVKEVSKVKKETTSTIVCEKNLKNVNCLIPPIPLSNENKYLSENYELTIQSLNSIENRIDSDYSKRFYQNNRMPVCNNTEGISYLENTSYIKKELSWHSDSQENLNSKSGQELSQTQEYLDIKNVRELPHSYGFTFASTSNEVNENCNTNDLQENKSLTKWKTTENHIKEKFKQKRFGVKEVLFAPKKCAVCYKVFNFQRDLIKHVQRYHSNGKAFKCSNCSKRYSKIRTLLIHSQIHRKLSKKKTQKRTQSVYKKKTSLNIHQKSHPNSRKHVCKFCSQTFDLIGQLRNHLKLHTEERRYSCHLCNKSYMYRQGLHRHLSLHTEDRNYTCTLCEKSFKDKATLEKHQKMHLKPKSLKAYACTNCYKSFDNELSLKLHLKLHTGERPYLCDLCEKSYIRKKDLNKHKRKVHLEDKSKSVNKDLYQTMCNDELDLNKHQTHLMKQKSNDCNSDLSKNNIEICSSHTFDEKAYVREHIKEHSKEFDTDNEQHYEENHIIIRLSSKVNDIDLQPMDANDINNTDYKNICKKGEKPLSDNVSETENTLKNMHFCKYCSRSFDQLGNLKCHLRSHSEERPFACSLCDKAYKHNSHLKQHQKIHLDTNELFKKHVCKICSKSFDLMGRLKNHLRTHSEERAFVCSFCEKAFKYKCDLNRHLKLLHSDENPYSCSLCSTSFTDKRSFNKHKKIHMNKKPNNYNISLDDEIRDLKNTIDIKEEFYSDSECPEDDMETKSVLEIFKTEYIVEEDIINSAVRLEDNF